MCVPVKRHIKSQKGSRESGWSLALISVAHGLTVSVDMKYERIRAYIHQTDTCIHTYTLIYHIPHTYRDKKGAFLDPAALSFYKHRHTLPQKRKKTFFRALNHPWLAFVTTYLHSSSNLILSHKNSLPVGHKQSCSGWLLFLEFLILIEKREEKESDKEYWQIFWSLANFSSRHSIYSTQAAAYH